MVRNKHNTPGIIKYPFWQMTYENPKSAYACINPGLERVLKLLHIGHFNQINIEAIHKNPR